MSSTPEIIVIDSPRFAAQIDTLWKMQEWQPHSHTLGALRYYSQRPQDLGFGVQDVSFVVCQDQRPVLGFLGALISGKNRVDLKAYEMPCLCLGSPAQPSQSALDLYLSEISLRLAQVDAAMYVSDYLQKGMFSPLALFLLRRGAQLTTRTYQLIDLTQTENELWRGLRKSYKSLVNRGERELRIEFMDAANSSWEGMNSFRELHIRVAGRETRSTESWRRQFQWVLDGDAFLVFGWRAEELVTVGMFTHTTSMCTYFSSASRRDLFDNPMFHALMWQGMLRARALGCAWFDVNEKHFQNTPVVCCQDKKLMSISEFKLGFGGSLKPVIDLTLDVGATSKDA